MRRLSPSRRPSHRPDLPSSLGVLLLLLLAPALLHPGAARPARAQAPTAGPDGRVLLVPDPGLRLPTEDDAVPHAEQEGLTVQNLGDADTRVLALYRSPADAEAAGCEHCGHAAAVCSPTLAPGRHARLASRMRSGGAGLIAYLSAAYALSEAPAADQGPAWAVWLDENGLPGDASVADVACHALTHDDMPPPGPGPRSLQSCPSRDLFRAWMEGGTAPFAPELPIEPFRGERLAGVLSPLSVTGAPAAPREVFDRLAAPGTAELLAEGGDLAARPRAWDLPGAWARTPDGLESRLFVHNPGPGCAEVELEAFRTSTGSLGVLTTTLAPDTVWDLDVASGPWSLNGSATLRLRADRPLAASLATVGPGISGASGASPVRELGEDRPWLVPLAYQERVDFASSARQASASPRAPLADPRRGGRARAMHRLVIGAQDPAPETAQGWESNLALFNPAPQRAELVLRLQGAGEPPRIFGYPIEPRVQAILQPGFGLGKPGGPGWGELAAPAPGVSLAVESLRSASDLEFFLAAWRARPDARAAPGRANAVLGLPSLGGPALGPDPSAGPELVRLAQDRESLVARVAIQNPTTATTRVAIDTYAACGPAGSLELRIDPRQTLRVPVRDLPGTMGLGADAARLRVLEGEASALVEVQRARRYGYAEAPPDLSTAYTAPGSPEPAAAPTWPEVRLQTDPVELRLGPGTPSAVLRVSYEGPRRCLSVLAEPGAPWLLASPSVAPVQGELTITVQVDPDRIPSGPTQTELVVRSEDPAVLDRRLTLPVYYGEQAPPTHTIYLPQARND